MTAQLSREELHALAVKKVESLKFAISQSAFTNIRRELEGELQLAEFALAAMSSEPVYQIWDMNWYDAEKEHYEYLTANGSTGRILYTSPPAPVAVPDAYELIAEAWRLMDGQNPQTAEWHSVASRYLNAHSRAAMLNPVTIIDEGNRQAEPVSAAYKLPELTNAQCLEFLTVAFRHATIRGDIEFDDIRLGLKMALSAAPEQEV